MKHDQLGVLADMDVCKKEVMLVLNSSQEGGDVENESERIYIIALVFDVVGEGGEFGRESGDC